jgi:hypothetical protein
VTVFLFHLLFLGFAADFAAAQGVVKLIKNDHVHGYFRFCLNPHLRAAGQRLIRAVDHGTRPMDHDFVALAVFFIRFDCEDGQVGALLRWRGCCAD